METWIGPEHLIEGQEPAAVANGRHPTNEGPAAASLRFKTLNYATSSNLTCFFLRLSAACIAMSVPLSTLHWLSEQGELMVALAHLRGPYRGSGIANH